MSFNGDQFGMCFSAATEILPWEQRKQVARNSFEIGLLAEERSR